jgi:hypothetical protein
VLERRWLATAIASDAWSDSAGKTIYKLTMDKDLPVGNQHESTSDLIEESQDEKGEAAGFWESEGWRVYEKGS